MTDVTLISLTEEWKCTFRLDGLSTITVSDLKSLCSNQYPDKFKAGVIHFLVSGVVIPSEDITLGDVVNGSAPSVEILFFVLDQYFGTSRLLKFDTLSICEASRRLHNKQTSICELRSLDWEIMASVLQGHGVSCSHAHGTAQETATLAEQPAAPAVALPAAPLAAQAPALPRVEWLQWGVMARLIVVAFLFTYNRHMTTEKMISMAAMTVFSYLFQIGAFGYAMALLCHKLGIDLQPARLPRPVPAPAAQPAAPGAAPGDQNGNAEAGAPAAPEGAEGANAPAQAQAAPRPAPAPVLPPQPQTQPQLQAQQGFVQSLVTLYHSGLTIPTAPGLLMDVLSFLMGLLFSIVPGWVPYRLY